ncbi:hypothetical protein HDV05_003740 [Chytridiales sp. JEL 0842]|nr:hypothetical protein HDV05_003740 [Chytridiales sp. JEL 0842]
MTDVRRSPTLSPMRFNLPIDEIDDLDESQPLLKPRDTDDKVTSKSLWDEACFIVPYAMPVSAGYVLQMSLGLAAIFTLGRYSTEALAAMALCTLYCNVTGFTFGVGMASALDTLCSQSYGEFLAGKVEKKALGRHLMRATIVMFLMAIPVAIVWCFTEEILLLAGQDPKIAALSARFTRFMIPGLFPYYMAESIKRFLQSQGIMSASLYVILIVSPINFGLQYLLVWSPWAIGPEGSPLAVAISYTILFFLLMGYVRFVQGGDAYGGWEWNEALDLQKLWMFVKLGTPGVLMTGTEWWAFEVIALASGLLGEEYLAAQTIVLNTCSLTYMLPLGLAISATTRIGNALGASCPNRGRTAAYAALLLGICLASFNSTVFVLIKDRWGYLWTDDEKVVRIVSAVLPLGAVFQLSDAVGAVSGGVLRGIGRQDLGAWMNVFGYYVVGLPFGVYACFKLDLKLFGLWLGLTIALVLVSFIQVFIVYNTDWKQESENAHKRVREERLAASALASAESLADEERGLLAAEQEGEEVFETPGDILSDEEQPQSGKR